MREKIALGNKEFKSLTEAARYVRRLMEGYSHGKHIIGEDFRLVLDLLKRFPDADEKIEVGVSDIILCTGIGSDRYFEIIHVDGTKTTSGYKGGLFPKKT